MFIEEFVVTVTVNIERSYHFDVKTPADKVFALLADVPKSASYFPNVHKLVDLGDDKYRWEMREVGIAHINLQTVYACKYVADPDKGSVVWKPVKGEGNALVSGSWKIADKPHATRLTLKIKGELSIPLPGLMQMLVGPVAENAFEHMIETYIKNLTKKFGGAA